MAWTSSTTGTRYGYRQITTSELLGIKRLLIVNNDDYTGCVATALTGDVTGVLTLGKNSLP